jgi:hypothetical protein
MEIPIQQCFLLAEQVLWGALLIIRKALIFVSIKGLNCNRKFLEISMMVTFK